MKVFKLFALRTSFIFLNYLYVIYTVGKANFPVHTKVIILRYTYATQTCNTAMERKFCQLLGILLVRNLRSLLKSTDPSKWDWVEIDSAQPNLSLKFRGCLRPIWTQMSHISSFSFKYHIFVHLRLLRVQLP